MLPVRRSIALAFLATLAGGASVVGQVSGNAQETIDVGVGEVFEIQAALEAGATINWTLLTNGEFTEAGSDPVFRKRFVSAGQHSLAALVRNGSTETERLFTLDVTQGTPTSSNTTADTDALVEMNHALTPGMQVVKFTPVRDDVSILAIDMNTSLDSNGDGNTQNDEDTKNTLFRSEGTPLHVWFIGGAKRNIRLGALLDDGSTQFQTINLGGSSQTTVGSGDPRRGVPIEQSSSNEILVLKSDNGEVQLALKQSTEETRPLLFLWNFGDGTQSMLDRPIHTYAESGRYRISVEIRDLKTSEVIDTVTDQISVNRLSTDVPDDEQKPTDDGEGGSWLGTIFTLLLSLIVSAAVGAAIVFIIGLIKKRNFSLHETIEKAEKTMVKTPEDAVNSEAPPMEISAQEVVTEPPPEPPTPEPPAPAPTPEPEPHSTHEPMEPSPQQLKADETAAPDWLQAGMTKAEEVQQTPDAPPPPTLEPTPEPTPEPPAPPPPPVEPEPQPEPPAPVPAPEPQPATPASKEIEENNDVEKEEREKERKRKKRQRYRENVKKRKEEEMNNETMNNEQFNDEPVAFITAEDIQPMEQPPEPEPPVEQEEDKPEQ